MYDVAIIGLGPAGSTLARLLDKRLSVIVLDKKDVAGDDGFHKPCGGLLATDAQKALSHFGLTLPLDVLVDPQIFSVRTIDVKANIQRHYQRFYMNLDRHKFDLWLKSLIPRRVDIHNNARCSEIRPVTDGYEISWREEGRVFTAQARYLVGADGASSMVRRLLYPGAKIRTYLSIQQWYEDHHTSPFYSCVFDSDTTDCYAWGLSKNDCFIFGGAFAPQRARENFEALKEKLKAHGFRFDKLLKTEACLVLRPFGFHQFYCGRDNAFLIGESAGFISPSSLEGMSYAFNSAWILSKILNRERGNLNGLYRRRTRKLRLKLLLKCLKSPFMYFPPLRRLVMGSGLKSIPVEPPPQE